MYIRILSGLMLTTSLCSSKGSPSSHAPIEIHADAMTYYQATNLFMAEGKVKVEELQNIDKKKNRIVWADRITYNKINDEIIASGNVIVSDELGNLTYTDQITIKDKFKQGLAEKIRLITKDNERILATKATRKDGNLSSFDGAAYTPCKVCKNDDPTWELKAEEVIHDKAEQEIRYKNARLELMGVPILYTPYFSHPDPTVKRRSGLLKPIIGSSSQLGAYYSQSMFYAIDDHSDATFTPVLMSNDNPLLSAEYRRKIMDGEFVGAASYISSKHLPKTTSSNSPINGPRAPESDRWHVFSKLDKDINEKNRLRLKVDRASDTTYLRRYPMLMRAGPQLRASSNLTSLINYEYLGANTYATARSYAYQTDQPKTTPFVLPTMTWMHQADENQLGGTWLVDVNLMSLYRDMPVDGAFGTNTHRLSSKQAWEKRYITDGGHEFHYGVTNQLDGYYTRKFVPARYIGTQHETKPNKFSARLYPQTFITYDYPLLSQLDDITSIMKPMVMLVAGGKHGNNIFIPDEDSRSFTLDDTNIMQPNRFNGRDRVDTGVRMVYGLDQTYYFNGGKQVNVFLGQTRRLDNYQAIDPLDGEDNKRSDIVGRILVQPIKYMNTRFRTAFDPNTKRMRFYEVGLDVGEPVLKADIGYVNLAQRGNLNKTQISQLSWQLSSQFHENWQVSFSEIRNLSKTAKGSLDSFAAIKYKNDCFDATLSVYKSHFMDRDIMPNRGFMLQLSFKNLATFAPVSGPVYNGSLLSQFTK